MKRNPKPFTIEIKKSRTPGQPHQPPSWRLFETAPSDVAKIFQTHEPQAVAEATATPRILPSIIEPVWINPEPSEPIRRKRSPRAKVDSGKIELILEHGQHREGAFDSHEEAATFNGTQLLGAEGAGPKPRKPRTKAPRLEEQAIASVFEPKQLPEQEVMDPVPVIASPKAGRLRLGRRQADAVRLPRSERWKRRLPPSAW